jgi:hypothetical protein
LNRKSNTSGGWEGKRNDALGELRGVRMREGDVCTENFLSKGPLFHCTQITFLSPGLFNPTLLRLCRGDVSVDIKSPVHGYRNSGAKIMKYFGIFFVVRPMSVVNINSTDQCAHAQSLRFRPILQARRPFVKMYVNACHHRCKIRTLDQLPLNGPTTKLRLTQVC